MQSQVTSTQKACKLFWETALNTVHPVTFLATESEWLIKGYLDRGV